MDTTLEGGESELDDESNEEEVESPDSKRVVKEEEKLVRTSQFQFLTFRYIHTAICPLLPRRVN